MKLITNLINRWEFSRLEPSTKSRNQLRSQEFYVQNKKMNAMRYIDLLAEGLPAMYRNGLQVDHAELLRKYYYRFDLPGINYYLRMVRRVNVATIENIRETDKLTRKIMNEIKRQTGGEEPAKTNLLNNQL